MLKKLTYINSILAACIGALWLLFVYLNNPETFTGAKDVGLPLLVVLSFVGIVGATTQLIGRAVVGELWALRLAAVLSVLWFLLCAILVKPFEYSSLRERYNNISEFLGVGLTPLVIVWGIIWVLKGALESRKKI